MITRMQQRRGKASEWQAVADTVILASGEIGIETDTGRYKIGDGATAWTNLGYFLSDDYNADTYAKISANQIFIGKQEFLNPDIDKTPLVAKGMPGQVGDLQQWVIESSENDQPVITEVASVSGGGVISANGIESSGNITLISSDPESPSRIRGLPNVYQFSDEAVSKSYVDTAQSGIAVKPPTKVATTANITLSGTQTIDTIAVAVGDRVLVKNQTDKKTNGIYIVASSTWTRATDTNSATNTKRGTYVLVESGTQNQNTSWVLYTEGTGLNGGINFGVDELVFEKFFNPGAMAAGDGLLKTGVTFSAVGTADKISVTSSGISIADTYPGQTSITTLGSITTGTWNASTIPVAKGGTGSESLTGFVYGNGTGPFSASPQIPGSVISGDISGNANNVSGKVAVANGGTGATTPEEARTSLGAAPLVSGMVPSINGGVPTGAIMMWYTSTPPTGWILCNGQSTSQYPSLAAVIGNNVPNMQERVPVGRKTDGSGTFGSIGAVGGATTHYHGRGNYAAAIGAINNNIYSIGYEPGARNPNGEGPTTALYATTGGFVANGTFNHYTPVYGQSGSASSLQPYIVINYIIKT